MPEIDDGSAEDGPGRRLRTAWVTLSPDEAKQLLESLVYWAEEADAGRLDPKWHAHIDGADGTELTIAIRPQAEAGR